jgi:hypothetical protein
VFESAGVEFIEEDGLIETFGLDTVDSELLLLSESYLAVLGWSVRVKKAMSARPMVIIPSTTKTICQP